MADQKTIEQRVKEIIVNQLNVNEEQITPTASFLDDLGADSLEAGIGAILVILAILATGSAWVCLRGACGRADEQHRQLGEPADLHPVQGETGRGDDGRLVNRHARLVGDLNAHRF